MARRATTSVVIAVLALALAGCTFGPVTLPTTTTSSTSTTSTTTTTTLPPTTTSTSTTTSTTSTTSTTTTTTLPLITEGAVIVVANASNVNGAAQQLSQELTARGFHLANATNAAGVEERLDASKVYFLPTGADVAASVGRVMGGFPVSRMPVPVSITGGPAALGEATVVVMLGTDIANKKTMLPD
jgi:LytR cell envelope-related transcriptional attenuator